MTITASGFDPDWEADTWEPESDSERDVVRALVRIRRECGIDRDEVARRLGVPPGLVYRLEDGTYPPYDELIARYALALGKTSIPLPYQAMRGDPATGWSCDEIEYDDWEEPRFRSIPAMVGSIGDIIDRHFPTLTRYGRIYFLSSGYTVDVEEAVSLSDDEIRDALARHSAIAFDTGEKRPRRRHLTYGASSGAKVMKRMIAAIDARSSKRYRKASLLLTDETRKLLFHARDEMGEPGFSLGEHVSDLVGPKRDARHDEDAYWTKRRRQIQRAVELKGSGRPSADWRDDCVREIALLWSCLSGDPIRSPDPAGRDPALCALGEMPAFVRDVTAVYEPWGLVDAVPGDSGAGWTRVLRPLLEKRRFLG